MRYPSFLTLCLIIFSFHSTFAQFSGTFSFTNQILTLGKQDFNSGTYVVGIADVNNDGLDDIIRLEDAKLLEIRYQQPDRSFDVYYFDMAFEDQQFNLAVADVDDDGISDLTLGDWGEGQRILLGSTIDNTFKSTLLPESNFLVQGANYVDIDSDGLLDIFVCNDVGLSKAWRNEGQGNFVVDPDLIDMNIYQPEFRNGGNYSSVWADYDNDGDLDLYLSKCFQFNDGPDDPRLLNQLFVNNGQDGFEEKAAEAGLDIWDQSWTTDFQDVDNDGDLDCFVVNHYDLSRLYLNDGNGVFTDITASAKLSIIIDPLQGALRDFDSDGYIDILVSSGNAWEIYRNQGDLTFELISDSFQEDYPMNSFAIGDVNHDGHLDIYSVSNIKRDGMWRNELTTNNFLMLRLEGVVANKSAVGTRIEYYGPWGVQLREVRSGESYGIMHSMTQHIGLGQEDQIDSLIIRWPAPSVQVDKYYNVQGNQFLHAVEGQCLFTEGVIETNRSLDLCQGDSVRLTAPVGVSYEWSTGATSRSITSGIAATYLVTITNAQGCTSVSQPVTVDVEPIQKPIIESTASLEFLCEFDTIRLTARGAIDYIWSTGESLERILVTEPGTYSVTGIGSCAQFQSDTIELQLLTPPLLTATADTLEEYGLATLTVDGGDTLRWFNEDLEFVGQGDTLEVLVNFTQNFFVESVIERGDKRCEA
ncbi:MAG: FG-GAP-like repeat-containing protein, partial [Bacteroidota bacterium]